MPYRGASAFRLGHQSTTTCGRSLPQTRRTSLVVSVDDLSGIRSVRYFRNSLVEALLRSDSACRTGHAINKTTVNIRRQSRTFNPVTLNSAFLFLIQARTKKKWPY